MSLLQAGFGSSGEYTIDDSLRFRSSASAYLNRTPASATNRKTWTWSGWVKRGQLGAYQTLFCAGASDAVSPFETRFRFNDTDTLTLVINGNGASGGGATTAAVFRDPSAWYHIVAYVDMSASGQANKARIYVNGILQTVTYSNFGTTDDSQVNNNVIHRIAANSFALSGYCDCYLTEVNFIDGQALTPSDFGEFDDNGTWKPLAYTGTYGTNGFYLNGVGVTDESGNGNDWTNNNLNLSTSTETTYDQMKDTPSLVDTNTGNFAVLNPLDNGGNTVSSGNLNVTTAVGFDLIRSTFFVSSGKWYWEVECTDCGAGFVGVSTASEGLNTRGAETSSSATIRTTTGNIRSGASDSSYGTAVSDGDVMILALDMDNGKFYAGKNGTWFNSGNPATSTNPGKTGLTTALSPSISVYNNEDYIANFGQRPFAYTPPSGFLKLNTFNLSDSTIEKGADYFNTVLWTGANTNAGNSVTGVGFEPDFVWAKVRSQGYSHLLYDIIRGTGATAELSTDSTGAEGSTTSSERGYLNSFDTDGFSSVVGSNGDNLYFNQTSETYVAWNWLASNTTASNTVGDITSTVSVNTTSGFSIVSYTGNGLSNQTVGHSLSQDLAMLIVKSRTGGPFQWRTWHKSLSGPTYYVSLSSTVVQNTSSTVFNGQSSTTFTVGNDPSVNTSGYSVIAYCFAEVEGYSAFGSYTGNGSADGPFIFTGFRPRYLMIKRTDVVDAWAIKDTARNTYNVDNSVLKTNEATAESTSTFWQIDILSNGFKLRNLGSTFNNSGGNYIYMAFAENPFKNANAR
jgi:hypothetical protein